MKRIYDSFQKLIFAFSSTVLMDGFIAALIANESGGDPQAERLEPSVLKHLEGVKAGEISHFSGITKKDLAGLGDAEIRALSTSYGLTQIMGYHSKLAYKPSVLAFSAINLYVTNVLLRDFQERFSLADSDCEKLFRCWNTGRPDGETTDSKYVANGMMRMEIYQQIMKGMASSAPTSGADDDFVVSDPEICL